MTSLIFYGGVNEIGGNKILLEDKDTKVFLDFGNGFGRRNKFFEEYLSNNLAEWCVRKHTIAYWNSTMCFYATCDSIQPMNSIMVYELS